MNIVEYIRNQKIWSLNTFGDGPRTKGITEHIRKELKEIEDNPTDVMEWVDVIILAIDGAWRAGHFSADIVRAMEEKQRINFSRTYPKPLSQDHPSEHVRVTAHESHGYCQRIFMQIYTQETS